MNSKKLDRIVGTLRDGMGRVSAKTKGALLLGGSALLTSVAHATDATEADIAAAVTAGLTSIKGYQITFAVAIVGLAVVGGIAALAKRGARGRV